MSRKKYGSGPTGGGFSSGGFYSGPSPKTIMGTSLANGMIGAANNFQTAQRNKQMMGIYMQNMQAQQQLRALQAQKLQQDMAPVQLSMQKLQMIHQAMEGGLPVPASVARDATQSVLDNIKTPQQAQLAQQAMAQHISGGSPSAVLGGGMPPVSPQAPADPTSFSMSPNEAKFYGHAMTNYNSQAIANGRNQSAQEIAQMHAQSAENQLNAKFHNDLTLAVQKGANAVQIRKMINDNTQKIEMIRQSTGMYKADQGLQGAKARAGATVKAATIRSADGTTPDGQTYDSDAAKSLLKQIQDSNQALIKGPPKSGLLPPMPSEVQRYQSNVQQHRDMLYNQYKSLTGTDLRGTPQGQAQSPSSPAQQSQPGYQVPAQPMVFAPQAPGAQQQTPTPTPQPAAPKPTVLPWDQRASAKPGDMVKAPDDKIFKAIAPGQFTPVDPSTLGQ